MKAILAFLEDPPIGVDWRFLSRPDNFKASGEQYCCSLPYYALSTIS